MTSAIHPSNHYPAMPNQGLQGRMSSFSRKLQLGATALQTVKKVANNGTELICGASAAATGVSKIVQGDLFSGAALAGAGALQLLKVFLKNENVDSVRRELIEAQGELEVMVELAEHNKANYETARSSIEHLTHQITRAQSLLRTSNSIATQGRKDLETAKKIVDEDIEESLKLSHQAQDVLRNSTEDIQKAQDMIKEVYNQVGELAALKAKNPEALKHLISGRVSKIQSELKKAQDIINRSVEMQKEGQELFLRSTHQISNASANLGRLQGRADEHFKQIQEETSKKLEYKEVALRGIVACEQGIDNADKQIFHGNNAIARIERVLNGETWEKIKMVAVGVAVKALGLGFLPTVGVGLAAIGLIQNPKIAQVAADVVFRVKEEDTQIQMSSNQSACFKFDGASTGLIGRYFRGGASNTAGQLTIKVGTEEFSCRLNFNNKPNAMGAKDLHSLSTMIDRQIRNKSLSLQQAKQLITELETMRVDRGPNNPQGLIVPKGYTLV